MSDKSLAERLIECLERRVGELEEENLILKNISRSRDTARGKPGRHRKKKHLKLIYITAGFYPKADTSQPTPGAFGLPGFLLRYNGRMKTAGEI